MILFTNTKGSDIYGKRRASRETNKSWILWCWDYGCGEVKTSRSCCFFILVIIWNSSSTHLMLLDYGWEWWEWSIAGLILIIQALLTLTITQGTSLQALLVNMTMRIARSKTLKLFHHSSSLVKNQEICWWFEWQWLMDKKRKRWGWKGQNEDWLRLEIKLKIRPKHCCWYHWSKQRWHWDKKINMRISGFQVKM